MTPQRVGDDKLPGVFFSRAFFVVLFIEEDSLFFFLLSLFS